MTTPSLAWLKKISNDGHGGGSGDQGVFFPPLLTSSLDNGLTSEEATILSSSGSLSLDELIADTTQGSPEVAAARIKLTTMIMKLIASQLSPIKASIGSLQKQVNSLSSTSQPKTNSSGSGGLSRTQILQQQKDALTAIIADPNTTSIDRATARGQLVQLLAEAQSEGITLI